MKTTKQKRHKTTIYLPDELLQALRELAEKYDRSLNGMMLQGLKSYIESQRKPEKKERSA